MGKKTSRPAAKVGSAASPASGLSQSGSKSSILRAAFSPSEYQLALFASVIQGLDGQHLRIHDTNTGRLQCEHALEPKEIVTSLDWGYYSSQGKPRDPSKKKRKRGSNVNDGLDQGDVVVAFGTNTSEIRMYSPSENKVVGILSGLHDKGIKDFKFTAGRPAQEAWSIGGDNKLVQWDLLTGKSLKTIHLTGSSVFTALSRPVPSNLPVICASQTPFLIDAENSENEPTKFPAMRNQIHTVISSSLESAGTGAFIASDGDRFINVFDATNQKLVRNLVADENVSSVSLYTPANTAPEKQVLAAITEDGTIELFTKPFVQPQTVQSSSAKASRKQMTQKPNASLKIVRSESSGSCVPVVSTAFQGNEIVVAYTESGVIPVFERVKFLDESTEELAFTGLKAVVKSKSSSAVASVTTNGAKDVSESRVNETHTVVESGNTIDDDIEMGDNSDAASVSGSEDSDNDDEVKPTPAEKKSKVKHVALAEDVEMKNAESDDEEEEEEEDGAEPSFGELLRAGGHEVDVEAELEEDVNMGALVPGKPAAAVQQIPTGVSLATVLTQSLKTNDSDMLESCFHTHDTNIIRSTIQRLDSSLAATLLQKLAERLASRPGRYGHLLVWIQWTCVAHGGALAGQSDLLKRMANLYKVMDQRSSSLPSLLLLKGKLDMLEAQLGLRNAISRGDEGMDSEDEDNVIYVEGQEESDSEVETKTPRKSIRDQAFDEDESMINGVAEDSDEDDSDEEEDDVEDIMDIEAEESADSSDADESLEENEDDDDAEDSEGSIADFVADTEDEDSEAEQAQVKAKKSKLMKKPRNKKAF